LLALALLSIAVAPGQAAPRRGAAQVSQPSLPEIRTSERNHVPACVTPERLMRFLTTRNRTLDDRFKDIAAAYQKHGEALRIRWDYAFFQMILETNYLIYKTGSGSWGDVNPKQNNFAGIGTTGGGVPGDAFPDVSTGVLAHMQHLIAYSGERVEDPVGRRTREKQAEIIQRSKMLGRPVTFRDLTRRWAVDPRYGTSIEFVASRFRAAHCNGTDAPEATPAEPELVAAKSEIEDQPTPRGRKGRRARSARAVAEVPSGRGAGKQLAARAIAEGDGAVSSLGGPQLIAPPRLAERPTTCKVYTASYGGERNVLIRAIVDREMQYTALLHSSACTRGGDVGRVPGPRCGSPEGVRPLPGGSRRAGARRAGVGAR
jgi:hypothetical protein